MQGALKGGIDVELTAHHRANGFYQQIGWVLFQKNAGGSAMDQPARLEKANDRCDHENSPGKSSIEGGLEKLEAALLPEVQIQQHQINLGRAQDSECFFH